MTICTPDRFWNDSTIGCQPALAPWLHDHGSLTQRIQQRCAAFRVHNLFDGLAPAIRDESMLLGVPVQQHAHTREVLLVADDHPVVFAHSVVAAAHLRGAWLALQHLGNRSLGSLLFSHPLMERKPLRYRKLRSTCTLHRRATVALGAIPATLWARRSLFVLHGAPLLVTEVFLPDILKLRK